MPFPSARSLAWLALPLTLACRGPVSRASFAREPAWSDGRIAGVALLANSVEVGYATIAATRATDRDVRSYAARMLTDHGSLNATLGELVARLDLAAQEDALGRALRDSSVARRATLAAAAPRQFDLTYLGLEVQSHRELLVVVDQLRAAGATRPELREYVDALRPAIVAHLAHAELLRTTLAARRR